VPIRGTTPHHDPISMQWKEQCSCSVASDEDRAMNSGTLSYPWNPRISRRVAYSSLPYCLLTVE